MDSTSIGHAFSLYN